MNYYNLFLNLSLLPLRIFRICQRIKRKDRPLLQYNNQYIRDPKTIISWNIQELFLFRNTNKLNNVIKYLLTLNVDVICLQEVFEDQSKDIIIKMLSKNYPYYLLTNTTKKYILGEDSGLLVLSKIPINFNNEVFLEGLLFPDSFSNKTIMYFSIGKINFGTTHLQSSYSNVSQLQLQKLIETAPFKKFILVGDLNNNNVCKLTGTKQTNYNFTCENEIIDYIIPIGYKNIKIDVTVKNIDLLNTSDHFPIEGRLDGLYSK